MQDKDQIGKSPFSEQVNSLYKRKEQTYIQNARVYMLWEIKHCPQRKAIKSFVYKVLKIQRQTGLMQIHSKYKAKSQSMWNTGTGNPLNLSGLISFCRTVWGQEIQPE